MLSVTTTWSPACEQRHHGAGGRHARGKRKRRPAVLDRREIGLERAPGRVLRPRVLVALVLAERLLHVGGRLIDRRDDGAGRGVGHLARVDADGAESRVVAQLHDDRRVLISFRRAIHGSDCRSVSDTLVSTTEPRARPTVDASFHHPPTILGARAAALADRTFAGRAARRRRRAQARRAGSRALTGGARRCSTRSTRSADSRSRRRRAGDRLPRLRRSRHRLLWRVRRKLILSYIFIGFVPVLLVVDLLHARRAAVLLQRQRVHAAQPRDVGRRRRADSWPDAPRSALQSATATAELTRSASRAGRPRPRRAIRSSRTPWCRRTASCGGGSPAAGGTGESSAGPWSHVDPPRSDSRLGAVHGLRGPASRTPRRRTAGPSNRDRRCARAVAWPAEPAAVRRRRRRPVQRRADSSSSTTRRASQHRDATRSSRRCRQRRRSRARAVRGRLLVGRRATCGSANRTSRSSGWRSSDYTDWETGESSRARWASDMAHGGPLHAYLSGRRSRALDNFNLGRSSSSCSGSSAVALPRHPGRRRSSWG